MQIIRDPAEAAALDDPWLRELVETRLEAMCDGDPYDPDVHGRIALASPIDQLEALDAAAEMSLLSNPVTGRSFGEADYRPPFEYVGRHPDWFEVVLVPDAGDFGIVLLIPDTPALDARLRALLEGCAESVPDPE